MSSRIRTLALLLPLVALAACSDDDDTTGTTTGGTATVRFVNATNGALDVAQNGTVAATNSNLGYGTSSSCLTVNAANPQLGFRTAGTTTNLGGFTPNFTVGGNYTVIATTGANGATQFTTLSNTNTPATGQARVRIFNAAPSAGNFDVYVTAANAALGTANATGVAYGTASNFFNVASGTSQVRFTTAGSQTVALNFGNQPFTAGQNSTIVIAPPAAGSTTVRAFTVASCT